MSASTATAALFDQACALHKQGARGEAVRLYRDVLAQDPNHADALYQLGLALCEDGAFEDGLAALHEAVARDPTRARAHRLAGVVLGRIGKPEDGLASLDRALALKPDNATYAADKADLLSTMGRLAEAVPYYDRALAQKPDSADDWCNRGAALLDLGRNDEAIASFDRAVALRPDFAFAHFNRGKALLATKQHDASIAAFAAGLAHDPTNADALAGKAQAHTMAGLALQTQERFEEALSHFRETAKLQPHNADAHMHVGNALYDLLRHEEAATVHAHALSLAPDNAMAHYNMANAQHQLRRYRESLVHYRKAMGLDPNFPKAANVHLNVASSLRALGDDAASEKELDLALTLRPNWSEVLWDKALLYLNQGRFREGWALHGHRFSALNRTVPRTYPHPEWNGAFVDGTLLAWAEQGLGEHIIHSSMVPEMQSLSRHLVLEVEPRLVKLFARSFPGVTVMPLGDALYRGRIDAQVALVEAGKFLRHRFEDFPLRPQGYLTADPARAAALRRRLDDGRKIIGLSWVSKNPFSGMAKSAQLRDFEAIFKIPDTRFIDLQYGDTRAERETLAREHGITVERLADIDNTQDIDGLAALMMACDAVVSISNTTAHLAGALGRPTWVFLSFGHAAFWYWYPGRQQDPWYPHVRVAQQREGQAWTDVFAAAAPTIAHQLASGSPSLSTEKKPVR